MQQITPLIVLKTLIKHETLTVDDLAKEENLGIPSSTHEVQPVLNKLAESGFVNALDNVLPATYTITKKGIKEGARLSEQVEA